MRALPALAWLAAAGSAHATLNARLLRRPPQDPPPQDRPVAVLIPARDEATGIVDCVRSVLAQRRVTDLRVLVLDDGSADDTAALVRALAGTDSRVSLLPGRPLPMGWLGKPHACSQLAAACPDVSRLVFLDADVRLTPLALAAALDHAGALDVDLLCPFPRQEAGSAGERWVQPLLAWSWLTTVPLRWAERSRRPSLAVAAGQFLVVGRAAYERAGGHDGVRGEVIEDLALARAIRRSGGRTAVVDGTALASCRMYDGWAQLRAGYTKSLWSAFGSPLGAIAVVAIAGCLYVVPAVAALAGSRAGLAGYLAAVAGRVVTARRMGSPAWPDALLHPVSVSTAGWLTAISLWQRLHGSTTWKGRAV